MKITQEQAIQRLLDNDEILIISHKNPDGDTLGCAFALYQALTQLGKTVRIECSDIIPQRYSFLTQGYVEQDFNPSFIVTVDVAVSQLLGKRLNKYKDKIDLCIDHHQSNEFYAAETFLDTNAAAACEIIYSVIRGLKAEITPQMANCIYTGIATDTGCFRYSNTTEKTHRIVANLFKLGADYESINRRMFDEKSKSRIMIEQQALNSIEYYYNDQVAIISISKKMIETAKADESELDGVSAIPRAIEGVEVGITIRERTDGAYKISIRTTSFLDASELCYSFDGGGHKRAAGCVIKASYKATKRMLLETVKKALENTQNK